MLRYPGVMVQRCMARVHRETHANLSYTLIECSGSQFPRSYMILQLYVNISLRSTREGTNDECFQLLPVLSPAIAIDLYRSIIPIQKMSNIPRQLHVPRDAEFLLYPEKSLYDLDTPPENLLPSRALENVSESEETIQEYRREAEETCRNPISYFLGPAPIVIHLNQVEFDKGDDFPAYREPEPLPKVNGNNMIFLEQITAKFE